MHKHRFRFWLWTALSAAAWVTAGFLIAVRWQGGAATFNGPFNSANAAAWVQAIGSLVAIGIAIYIPHKLASDENQRREADRVQRARLLAAKLLVPTINLRFEALRLQACLSPLPAGKDHSAPIYWNHGTPHRLDDIESIKKEWGELAVLDRLLGEKFAILITVVDAYNRRFDSLSRDSYHPLAPARLARESPELAQMAASIAELAGLTHNSARQQSLHCLSHTRFPHGHRPAKPDAAHRLGCSDPKLRPTRKPPFRGGFLVPTGAEIGVQQPPETTKLREIPSMPRHSYRQSYRQRRLVGGARL